MKNLGLVVGLLSCMLLGSALGEERQKVTAAEMKEYASRVNTYAGVSATGYRYLETTFPDGTRRLYITAPLGQEWATDEGTYEIRGDQWCGAWKKMRAGREACDTWYRIGENKIEYERSGRTGGWFYILE